MTKTKNNLQNSNPTTDSISDKVRERFMKTMKDSSHTNTKNNSKSSKTRATNIDDFKNRINNLRAETKSSNPHQPANSNSDQSAQKAQNSQKVKELEERIRELESRLKQTNDKYLKAVADLQNTHKQHELDLASAKKSAKKGVATTLSGFINTFNLAFSYQPEIRDEDEKILKFVKTLQDSFEKSIKDLEIHNIKFLIPKAGDSFDPKFMEILNPDNIQDEENVKVKQVVSSAIQVDEQLIQPASVMV